MFRRKGIRLFYRQHHHHMCWKPMKSCFFPSYDQIPSLIKDGSQTSVISTLEETHKKVCSLSIFFRPLDGSQWLYSLICSMDQHKIDFTFRTVHYGTFHVRNILLLRPHVLKLKSPMSQLLLQVPRKLNSMPRPTNLLTFLK